ncbi:MAG: glycoside hydrolase family 2, partial [Planctomycetota bacterium]|nr:glycoside hydrolase family 2 [Planctomycetota bacterium]
DTVRFRSTVTVRAGGGTTMRVVGRHELKDDPADHRGILSWHSQKRDRKLREAGSYGYLLSVPLSADVLEAAAAAGKLRIRLEVDAASAGGLAVYGERFGRYPLDPTVALTLKP